MSSTRIDLAWTDTSSNEDEFRVERDSGAGFVEIAVLSANTTAHQDLGLTPSTTYSYRVRAYSIFVGYSAYSNVAQATTPAPPATPPADPTLLTAVAVSATQIDLAWTDNSTDEDGFRIERDDGAGFFTVGSVLADVTSYSNTGLNPSTAYSYRVFAFNGAGDSLPTNVATATTPAGTSQWEQLLNGTANGADLGVDVAVDATGIYVCGRLNQTGTADDVYVAKLDPADGTVIWSQTLDGGSIANDYAEQLALLGSDLYVTGAMTPTAGVQELWVAKFDTTTGTIGWQQTRPGLAGTSIGYAIAADATGAYVVGSTTDSGTDSDVLILHLTAATGTIDWEYAADGGAVNTDISWAIALDSTAVYAGGAISPAGGTLDPWVAKFDLSGTKLWETSVPTAQSQLGFGLALGGGRVFLHWGTVLDRRSVMALDQSTGAIDWNVLLALSTSNILNVDPLRSVVWDSNTVYVVGQREPGTQNIIHALVDSTGAVSWVADITTGERTDRVLVEPGVALYAAGFSDGWITKRSLADGSILWEKLLGPDVTQVRAIAFDAAFIYGVGMSQAAGTSDLWVKQFTK